MYTNPQKISKECTVELRREAGLWLKKLREQRGISQRGLADMLGVKYYTFISQLENGRGRLPPDRYHDWAKALDIPVREFVVKLMKYYDPLTYSVLFDEARCVLCDKDDVLVVGSDVD